MEKGKQKSMKGDNMKTFFETQNIEDAKKFAEKINKACKIVEKLNAMQITVNYGHEEKPDRESYMALITKYMEELQGLKVLFFLFKKMFQIETKTYKKY